MSNCIQVLTPRIIIPLKMVKLSLLDLVEKAEKLGAPPKEGECDWIAHADLDMAYWFASSRNVSFFKDRLLGEVMLVDLEGGRSSHSYRSLKALSIFFRKYLTGNLRFNLKVCDVDNDITSTESYTFSGVLPKLSEVEFWARQLKSLTWRRDEADMLRDLESAKRFDFTIEENLVAREQALKLNALRAPLVFKKN